MSPDRIRVVPAILSLVALGALGARTEASAVERNWAADDLRPATDLEREGARWIFSAGVPVWDLENETELIGDDGFDIALDLTAAYWPGADMITDHAGAHFGAALNFRWLYAESDSGSSSFEAARYDLSLRYLLGLHWYLGGSTSLHLTGHIGAGLSYLTSESSGPGFSNSDSDFGDGFFEYGATLGVLVGTGRDSAFHAGVELSGHQENLGPFDVEYHWLVPKAGLHLRF